jgi:metallo-beta-lactamase family protein
MNNKVKITFAGGAITPTGSNFILEYGNKKFLIDCGSYQGSYEVEAMNHMPFPFDVNSVDGLFITHGHLDHVGRIGKLYADGYTGPTYSTPPTRDIGELIMLDSLNIMDKDSNHNSIKPIYQEKDVLKAMSKWYTLGYHDVLPIKTDLDVIKVSLLDAGHIMGSSMVQFEIEGKKFLFTGDLGNTPSPLLRDTEKIKDINYLIMESVYGDRNHEDQNDKTSKLKNYILKTIKRGGTLMIPAFSVERTQELLFYINSFVEQGLIPKCKIYLDSPLGIKVTNVYKKYEREYMNTSANQIIKSGDDIFNFPGLTICNSKEESMEINNDTNAKIIIAGSGMSTGGRIIHHEIRYLSDPRAMLLLVGYQAVGTLGRLLYDGIKKVKIHNSDVRVKCEVNMIGGFSAHKDSDNLVDFVSSSQETLKKVFIVLGEPKSSMFLAQRIHEYLDLNTHLPDLNETVEIDL